MVSHMRKELAVDELTPSKLTDRRWREPDEFEGETYPRMLIPIGLQDRGYLICTVYVRNADSTP